MNVSSISQLCLEHSRYSTDIGKGKVCLNILQNGFNLEISHFLLGYWCFLDFKILLFWVAVFYFGFGFCLLVLMFLSL